MYYLAHPTPDIRQTQETQQTKLIQTEGNKNKQALKFQIFSAQTFISKNPRLELHFIRNQQPSSQHIKPKTPVIA